MKIQCDVCDKDEASVFCVADEAALCAACDRRVHHANKLAGKHQRFSLHHPSPKQVPICDICQERRAFLFCQQDRAILCKECDVSIHKANEHTLKHTRFLLTGVKLSATSSLYSAAPSSTDSESSVLANDVSDVVPNTKSRESKNKLVSVRPTHSTPFTSKSSTVQCTSLAPPESCDKSNNVQLMSGGNLNGTMSTSSISEYLMETLPGWHFEDFLDSSSSPYGFCKNGDNDVQPFLFADSESNLSGFPAEKLGFWVPQVPHPLQQTENLSYQSVDIAFEGSNGLKEHSKEFAINNVKSCRKWSEDDSFAVPQIRPPSSVSKRYKTFW